MSTTPLTGSSLFEAGLVALLPIKKYYILDKLWRQKNIQEKIEEK